MRINENFFLFSFIYLNSVNNLQIQDGKEMWWKWEKTEIDSQRRDIKKESERHRKRERCTPTYIHTHTEREKGSKIYYVKTRQNRHWKIAFLGGGKIQVKWDSWAERSSILENRPKIGKKSNLPEYCLQFELDASIWL